MALVDDHLHNMQCIWISMTTIENMERSKKDKLVKLREMMIGYLILKNKSEYDWEKYVKRNDEEWIRREGIMILLSEEAMDLMADKKEKEVREIFGDMISLKSREISVQCFMVRLCTSVSDRFVRCVMRLMVQMCEDEPNYNTIVIKYLIEIQTKCKNLEMVKWAELEGGKFLVELKIKMKMSRERRDRLHTALTRHSTQTCSETLEVVIDRDWWDMHSNIEHTSLCKNVAQYEKPETPCVKLSSDRLEARHDGLFPVPVCSPFPVKSNVYFYEVICVTNVEMRLGWCTRDARFDSWSGFGTDKHSDGLQIGNLCFLDPNNHPIHFPTTPRPINVFGCLIDVENRRFEYYFNGRTVDCPAQEHFSRPPYFATVFLSPHQQCKFNFGQTPFKFPPRNIRFTSFHEQTGGDESKYRLMDTFEYSGEFWFAQTPVNNQVSLFFDDEKQNKFNSEVRRVEGNIESGEWGQGGDDFYHGHRGLRYIQAIIEMMGNVICRDKVDVMAQWVGQVVENGIDEDNKYKLVELLYPYLQLVIYQSTIIQHRSICIVLLHLIKCDRHQKYDIIEPIHSSVFTYLTRTLTSSPDHWTQLFVLIALANLKISKAEKRHIEGCAKMRQMMKTCRGIFEGKDVGQLIKSGHRLFFQLYLFSLKLLNSIYPNAINRKVNLTTPATLNQHDLTPQLTLSPCHLSARSDWHWQSVRSVCQVSAHIYYFEVVLLTAGPMTLGWATKRTDLTKITKIHPRGATPIMVGFDEFSIGFDGFNRCIYHDYKTFQLENIPQWKAGDIVGCLIDTSQKHFKFYLNGIPINFNPTQSRIFFSSQPYHALLSLSQFQQVYLNFGQSPFSSNRPKYIDFCDFYSNKPEVNEIQTKTVVNFNNANLEKNLISIDSNVKNGDVIITGNASTSKRSVESEESIGNISSVHTIASVNIEEVNNSQIKRSRMECRLCCSSSSTQLVRFVCCEMLPMCLDCLRVMTQCPKCKKQTNHSQTDDNQTNEPKPTHPCTLCSKQRASFRFISCDHFNLCQTCVNQISFKDCPKCN